jgi:hypothetical protein
MPRFLSKLAFSLTLALPLVAQYYPGVGRGIPRGGSPVGPVLDAVATIDGVFKSADKKFVEVQVESGDTMRMYITHSTKFIRDGKTVKSSEFHDGDKVTADATRDARMNMLAVKIELKKPGQEPKEDKPKEDKPEKPLR